VPAPFAEAEAVVDCAAPVEPAAAALCDPLELPEEPSSSARG
jgi:hypothetical protein